MGSSLLQVMDRFECWRGFRRPGTRGAITVGKTGSVARCRTGMDAASGIDGAWRGLELRGKEDLPG
jgi:hypothetical protein